MPFDENQIQDYERERYQIQEEVSLLRKETATSAESCASHQREIMKLSEELAGRETELQSVKMKLEEERGQRSRAQGDLASTLETHRSVGIKSEPPGVAAMHVSRCWMGPSIAVFINLMRRFLHPNEVPS